MQPTATSAERLTAKSLTDAFAASNKKHLIITGSLSSGKSTLFRQLSGKAVHGFTTKTLPKDKVILTDNFSKAESVIGVYSPKIGKMLPNENGFMLGIKALEANCDEIFIDEIGYLESDNEPFKQAIRNAFDSKKVTAVIRKQDTVFLKELLSRNDVFVVDLNKPKQNIACVINASGNASRFGANKLIAEMNGKALIAHIIQTVKQTNFAKRIVVTKHKQIEKLCSDYDIPCLLHSFEDKSQAVALSVKECEENDGIVFCNGDQPFVSRKSLENMCFFLRQRPDDIIRLGGKSPVLFGKAYFDELKEIPLGKSGNFVISNHTDKVITVNAVSQKELVDIDTKEELKKYTEK